MYQTVEELKTHPIFQSLSGKQQQFVLAFIELKGDRAAAASRVYKAKSPDAVGMRALRTALIRQILAIFYGYSCDQAPVGKKELVGLIAARLRNVNTTDSTFTRLVDNYLDAVGRRCIKRLRRAPETPETPETPEATEAEVEISIDDLVRDIETGKRKVAP